MTRVNVPLAGMRKVKEPTLCWWPDGSASTRYLIHSNNPSEIEVYYMHADSTVLHRSNGGPARVIVSATTHMPVLVLWCENDTWSQRRLAAGLPTCFDENYFEWIEHTGNHNPNGPAVVYNDGDYAYHIKSARVSTERFGEQYMITHLEEYAHMSKEQAIELYDTLHLEMMGWVEKELAML